MGQTAKLSIQLLGGLNLSIDGKPLPAIPSRAIEAALVYAACHKTPVSRDRLINLIWDASEPKQASANLRAALSALRKIAGDYVEITRQQVAVKQDLVDVDALVFEQKMADLSALSTAELESTLALYEGDFLAQFRLRSGRDFEDWMMILRERLRRRAVDGLRQLVQNKLDSAEFSTGIRHAARWLNYDPYSESAHRQMMWLLLRDGQRNAALRQYEKCRRILNEEIGVEPSNTTKALYYQIRDLPFPPPTNLPTARTQLIGRNAEISQLSQLMASQRGQLVTLLGPGGVGKTRLAMAVGHRIAKEKTGQFLQGVYFISLAAIETLDELIQALATAMEVSLRGNVAGQQLIQALADYEVLLILDNFEQLLASSSVIELITDLLQSAPAIKLLVTSRERLDLYQETIFDVSGLDLPVNDAANPADSDAVKLFVQRAQQVRRDYQPETYAPVIEACRLVSGSPLAIELAASWVRYLSPEEIASNVAQSLGFLETRNRDLPARHRSLQAVFDHSWQLLQRDEQAVLASLAVFPDHFDVAAANAVSNTSLSMLTTLVDKSLLTSDASRYALHATVRSFSLNLLNSIARAEAERKLVAHYASWLDAAFDAQTNAIDPSLVSAEIINIRSAWQLAIQHNQQTALYRMMSPLFAYLIQRGWFAEGIERFTSALAVMSQPGPFLLRRARFYIFTSDYVAAERDLRSASAFDLSEEDSIVAIGYDAIIRIHRGELQQAYQLCNQAVTAARATDNHTLHAFALNLLGGICKPLGKYAEAKNAYSEAIDIRRQQGDKTGEAILLNNLGTLSQGQLAYDEASRYYEQASLLFKQLNQPVRAAVTLSNAGNLAWKAGNFTQAQNLLGDALTIRKKHGNLLGVAITSINLCHVLVSLNQISAASQLALTIQPLLEAKEATRYMLELYLIAANIAQQAGATQLQHSLLQYILTQDGLTQETRTLAEASAQSLNLDKAEPSHPPKDIARAATKLFKANQ